VAIRDDGIPNILSPDSTFVNDLRQKAITKGKSGRIDEYQVS